MKSPNKTQGARRTAERTTTEKRGVAEAMTDALEDILAWERASERMLKVADASTADVSAAASTSASH